MDVRDVARAHVLAMTAAKASNKRILVVSGLITPQLVATYIRERFPELKERVASGNPSRTVPEGVALLPGWDVSRSHEVFGASWSYRGLEESVADTVGDIVRHEREWT